MLCEEGGHLLSLIIVQGLEGLPVPVLQSHLLCFKAALGLSHEFRKLLKILKKDVSLRLGQGRYGRKEV
ncbi:MAG: hypothetical protein UY95_C0015G0021 [Parcubacteria group bacterium GW2011_GWA2_56_7]|nr:MAG: hypothetical protein UY95_C0015G0021 [Parcubacteria group bacterium GW2011_GWA2_56_7]